MHAHCHRAEGSLDRRGHRQRHGDWVVMGWGYTRRLHGAVCAAMRQCGFSVEKKAKEKGIAPQAGSPEAPRWSAGSAPISGRRRRGR